MKRYREGVNNALELKEEVWPSRLLALIMPYLVRDISNSRFAMSLYKLLRVIDDLADEGKKEVGACKGGGKYSSTKFEKAYFGKP